MRVAGGRKRELGREIGRARGMEEGCGVREEVN